MPSTDRRHAVRCDVRRPIRIYHASCPTLEGKTTNITEADVHFVAKQNLPLRELTQIQIEIESDVVVSCLVMITRCEPASLGRWAYGAKIVSWNGNSVEVLRAWLLAIGHEHKQSQAA